MFLHPGEAIPLRVGLEPEAQGQAAQPAALQHVLEELRPFPAAAARFLPPFVVMSSCGDHMVPWHEGAEFCCRWVSGQVGRRADGWVGGEQLPSLFN